jgi:predicted CoA-substrate-specific enzyme activase
LINERDCILHHTYSLGIDVGSVSTNLVLVGENNDVAEKLYLRTSGRPIEAMTKGLGMLAGLIGSGDRIAAAGTTGSGRQLAAALISADAVKNEITAHAAAACRVVPGVRTILEIGGQDSKIILLRDGIAYDFAMNTVCAAGTGSFLDRQAARLEIPIEEFGSYALRSRSPVRIAGRCAVFAESDMIHKQQTGHSVEDIIAGLCEAMVRNYLNNLAKGKKIEEPVVFQGGVAANVGIAAAFEKILGVKIIIPQFFDVMGAYGAALIAREEIEASGAATAFCGLENISRDFSARSLECRGCSNMCEVIRIYSNGMAVAHWGDKCGKYAYVKSEVS